ncbi:hypothetical protein P8813_20360, partial [Bacillus velezensis]|uniref:hypothetical protein n=1 Tax=Bacillus velezensis TaxID=492670 RepID=UPI002DBB0EB4
HSTAVSSVASCGDGAILEPSKKGITKDNTLIQEHRLTVFSFKGLAKRYPLDNNPIYCTDTTHIELETPPKADPLYIFT